MSAIIAKSKEDITFSRQPQGFYISRKGHVLVYMPCDPANLGNFVAAKERYDQICDLYRRLFEQKPAPRPLTVNILAWIVNPPPPNHRGIPIPNGHSIKALMRRGLVRKKPQVDMPHYVHDFEPIYTPRLLVEYVEQSTELAGVGSVAK